MAKLIKLRLEIKAGDYKKPSTTPCFYIIGRVRMGGETIKFLFMFSPAATAANEIAIIVLPVPISALITPGFVRAATCPVCNKPQYDKEGEMIIATSNDRRSDCKHSLNL
jgi:hypothetical protein